MSLESGELEILMRLLVCSLSRSCEFDLWSQFDMVAALPIHSLALANNQASLDLLVRLVEERPELLPEAHGEPVFSGENVLHVLIVNRREDLVCELLDIAAERLSDELMSKLLQGQATGSFFTTLPQRNFGGTPLAYAACFGMRRCIYKMLTLVRPLPPDPLMEGSTTLEGSTVSLPHPTLNTHTGTRARPHTHSHTLCLSLSLSHTHTTHTYTYTHHRHARAALPDANGVAHSPQPRTRLRPKACGRAAFCAVEEVEARLR